MESNRYILSICIPTYNRAQILRGTLTHITNLSAFLQHPGIEIVISDNCSTDETGAVADEFVKNGSGRIRYFKNAENVHDRNFEMALRRGRGEYLKLSNDTVRYTNDGLEFIYATINNNEIEKPVLFFRFKDGDESEYHRCQTMDDFMISMSYHSTWIAGYGIWKEHLALMPDFSRKASLKLLQVDALLQEFLIAKSAICCSRSFCDVAEPKVKSGYSISEVFGKNYAAILKAYRGADGLTKRTIQHEKYRMLYSCIIPTMIFPPPNNFCARSGYLRCLIRDYSCFWTYWIVMPVALLARFVRLKREYASAVKRLMDRFSKIKNKIRN